MQYSGDAGWYSAGIARSVDSEEYGGEEGVGGDIHEVME